MLVNDWINDDVWSIFFTIFTLKTIFIELFELSKFVRIQLPVNELMNYSVRQQRADRFILHPNSTLFMTSIATASYYSMLAFSLIHTKIEFIFGHSISMNMNKHEHEVKEIFMTKYNKKLFIKPQQRINIYILSVSYYLWKELNGTNVLIKFFVYWCFLAYHFMD